MGIDTASHGGERGGGQAIDTMSERIDNTRRALLIGSAAAASLAPLSRA